jgi:hypothetical protein
MEVHHAVPYPPEAELIILEMAMHRGVVTGVAWAHQLLQPLSTAPRPKCPYPIWRPLRRFAWRMGVAFGTYSVLHHR